MEIIQEISNQYVLYIPIALVIVGAILVFTFGFKAAEQPPFDKLTIEDRKSAGKKRKIKEKKSTVNGYVSTGESKSEKSPAKDSKKSPSKESEPKQEKKDKKLENKQSEKNKKNEVTKTRTIAEEIKNKKNTKKVSEKPVDFDDGNWETVPTKSDKKKKDSPVKNDKKSKKNEKVEKLEIEKLADEVVNNEPKETEEKKSVQPEVESNIEENKDVDAVEPSKSEIEERMNVEVEEPVPIIEEKKEKENKKKEKKPKKESAEKPTTAEEIEEKIVGPTEPPLSETYTEFIQSKPEEKSEVKDAAPAFDELGDVWTDAKIPKKSSKKKARRDN